MGSASYFWQIGRQARNAIRQNQHSEALKRKLVLYEQLIEDIGAYADAELDVSSFVRNFTMDVTLFKLAVSSGYQGNIPRARYPTFSALNDVHARRAIALIAFIERWRILDSRISVFQTAFNVALHECQNAVRNYLDVAMRSMPVVRPDGAGDGLFPWAPPSDANERSIQEASDALLDAYGLMGCYAMDFQTEMQRLLVGELFSGRIEVRQPIDPRFRPVTLNDYKALEKFFDEETDWGRYKVDVTRRTTAPSERPQEVKR